MARDANTRALWLSPAVSAFARVPKNTRTKNGRVVVTGGQRQYFVNRSVQLTLWSPRADSSAVDGFVFLGHLFSSCTKLLNLVTVFCAQSHVKNGMNTAWQPGFGVFVHM